MPDAGRVISGTARGVRLLAPGTGTRPLGDRVKQALFGSLEAGTFGAWPTAFLDLFAGSGAGGIEALSRGATSAVFVESDDRAARIIADNVRRAGFAPPVARVVRADVNRWLGRGALDDGGPFGAVLLDPPYGDAAMLPALERLGAGLGWLSEDAVTVAKHFWRDELPERIGVLQRTRERRFGETMLTFYELAPPPSTDPAP